MSTWSSNIKQQSSTYIASNDKWPKDITSTMSAIVRLPQNESESSKQFLLGNKTVIFL